MTVKKLLKLSAILILTISCKSFPPPEVELCGATIDGDLACNDKRREEPDYFRDLKQGDICSDGQSFSDMRAYCIDLRKKLIQCRKQ